MNCEVLKNNQGSRGSPLETKGALALRFVLTMVGCMSSSNSGSRRRSEYKYTSDNPEYRKGIKDVGNVYGISDREVDATIQRVLNGINGK